jgi:predicted nucleotidyltransferase
MTTSASPHSAGELPPLVRDRLTELQESLEHLLGDDLVALIVYGSAARGGYREGTSDVDLMIVLRQDVRERLERISNAMQLARYSARIEAMILTEDEIPRAADVFPLLYDDIRRCHLLIYGRDPFAGLEIHDHHRRLRIEQELREAQIRLRRAVVDGRGMRGALAGAIDRKLKQIRSPMHALLALRGIEVDDRLEPVIAAAGRRYQVDVGPLLEAHLDPVKAHQALTDLLKRAIDDVDQSDTEGRT